MCAVDTEDKHALGYWMSVLGFALVVFVGLFYSFVNLDAGLSVVIVASGFVLFLAGAELALRNQNHVES